MMSRQGFAKDGVQILERVEMSFDEDDEDFVYEELVDDIDEDDDDNDLEDALATIVSIAACFV
jgi:hypothetical protein